MPDSPTELSAEPDLATATACIACGARGRERFLDQLWRCTSCGFAWWDERDSIVPEKLYDDSYFFGGEYVDYPAEREALDMSFRQQLRMVRRHVPGGRLLEVGCAYGYFLDIAREHFEVTGVDVNQRAVDHARDVLGLDARCGDFQRMEFEGDGFDAVVSLASIEHFARPDLLVARASELLRPGGVFVCTTPDLSSAMARLRGPRWRMIHPPTHVSYFTRTAMARLFERHALRPVRFTSVGQHRTVNNVLYTILDMHGHAPRLYALLRRLGLTRGRFYLNTFDVMFAAGVRQ